MFTKLNRNDIASIRRANVSLETFRKKVEKNQEKMAKIDEEYRLKAEKKKESLVTDTQQLQQTVDFWNNSTMQLYGKTVDELMDIIATSSENPEPPLFVHDKTTDEEIVNPVALATNEEAEKVEEVVDEPAELIEPEVSEEIVVDPEADEPVVEEAEPVADEAEILEVPEDVLAEEPFDEDESDPDEDAGELPDFMDADIPDSDPDSDFNELDWQEPEEWK